MEITANALQTVATTQNVLFTDTPVKGCCSILHRDGSGLITLRGLTHQKSARFKVTFGGNIAVPSGGTISAISLAVAISGEPVNSTSMIVTPASVGEFFNIFTSAIIDVPCGCCSVISVENTSTQSINVQNANLIVERIA